MAIIKVITPSVTDANITTAKVTDNAITLGKMASGTDGNIISYDASGNPVAVATGNSGQILTSAGAGAIPSFQTAASAANTPLFRAYANANWNTSSGTDTSVPFNAESFDPQGTFNTSNGKFTPGVSGKYFFYIIIKLSSTQDQGLMELYLLKNNSVASALTARGSGTGSMSLQLSAVLVSDTNDFFDVAFYQNSGGTITAFGGEIISYFTAFKLIE